MCSVVAAHRGSSWSLMLAGACMAPCLWDRGRGARTCHSSARTDPTRRKAGSPRSPAASQEARIRGPACKQSPSLLKPRSPRGSCSRWHLLPPTSGCHSFPGYRGLKIAQKRPRSSCGFNLDGQAARGPLSGAAPRPPGCFPPARHPPPRAPPSSACRRTSVPGRTGV